jgi:hypothetical protein
LPGRFMVLITAPLGRGYHAPIAVIHHKSVGLRGGHQRLFMIDRIHKHLASPDFSGRSGEFNRAE